jgi:glucosyl-3-phosphoglycerate synthase
MADFFQNGIITTLHDVGNRSLESLEAELKVFSERRNMVLILPALYSEFETPAMHKIIDEIKDVDYLHKIVLGLDQADEAQFKKVKELMSVIKTPVDIIWNDGPRIKAMYDKVGKAGFNGLDIRGKGRNVWMCLGYALTYPDSYAIAMHDCDIVNYTRELPARLFYPVVHPGLDFEFNKGYYARVTGKLHGRVTRLFYSPLIKSLEKIFGHNRYIDYMDSFRYALSGEFAFIRSLGRGMRISPTWGLEVSTLSEVYSNTSTTRICQTEIMSTYEHKHQDISRDSIEKGLAKMADEIAQTIFRVMSQSGMVLTPSHFQTLIATYYQESRYAILKYNALSKMNGLEYNRQAEIEAVEIFQQALHHAQEQFQISPMGVPSLSAWTAIRSVLPDFSDKLKNAVLEDNR